MNKCFQKTKPLIFVLLFIIGMFGFTVGLSCDKDNWICIIISLIFIFCSFLTLIIYKLNELKLTDINNDIESNIQLNNDIEECICLDK